MKKIFSVAVLLLIIMFSISSCGGNETPNKPQVIISISVCSPTGTGGQGSCPNGSYDTHQIVLAPDGTSIDEYAVVLASDEHSSVFSPGTLGENSDYLFFVAGGVRKENHSIGAVVLSGGSGPSASGQWTMDFPKADGYGQYGSDFGQVFLASTAESRCPKCDNQDPTHQDQTFDLTYAAPGSVVLDPTSGPGNLLMIYEGTNGCVGNSGGDRHQTGEYISVGVATSLDYGRTWPTYRGTSSFDFVELPDINRTQGPNAPSGAVGSAVCMGNDCTTTPPATYGRYPILTLPVSLADAMTIHADGLDGKLGLAMPSAFVDNVGNSPAPYLYVVHGYAHGDLGPPLPNDSNGPLIARAQLNGGTAKLSFLKWNGQAFANPGVGGDEYPLLPDGPYCNCGDSAQSRGSGSIYYVEATKQYLLIFVCGSPTDPASGQGTGKKTGSAWFYCTSNDVSDPSKWSTPQEIIGSWSEYSSTECDEWKGWYPTFMSLGRNPGHLSLNGYVFYSWGCMGAKEARQYSSRAFTITTGTTQ